MDIAGRTRPLHVAHVLETLRAGGAEMAVSTLAPRTAALGVRTTLVSIYADNLTEADRARFTARGVGVVTIGRAGRRDVAFFPRLVAALRSLRPDVVHGHVHAGKYAGRAAAIVAGVPSIVYTAHGESHLDGRDAYGLFERLGNGLLNPRTARFVTFTEAQRQRFAIVEGVPLARVSVVPNGVPVPERLDRTATRAALGLREDAVALYMPARLAAVKGHAVAIDAVASLGAGGARFHLVFAGAGPDEAALRARARERGLESRTHWLGFRRDAASLASVMDYFLLPSMQERMPLALGEAMLLSLPVVTTPWEGARDFVDDGATGYVAGTMEAGAFAAAIARAASDPGRAEVVRRAEAVARERFDVDRWAERHVALYADLDARARRLA